MKRLEKIKRRRILRNKKTKEYLTLEKRLNPAKKPRSRRKRTKFSKCSRQFKRMMYKKYRKIIQRKKNNILIRRFVRHLCVSLKYKAKNRRYHIRRKSTYRIKKHVENLFNKTKKNIQPLWRKKKLAYILSYFKMFNNTYNYTFIKQKSNKTATLLSNNTAKLNPIIKQKKTFKYNHSNHEFIIRSKDFITAKSYKKIKLTPYTMFKKSKDLLWNIMYKFKLKNKKTRKKARKLRFRLRILKKMLYSNKNRYRKKKLYKKVNKNLKKKKIVIKLKNKKLKKITINFSKKNQVKIIKIKRLIKLLELLKKRLYRTLKCIRIFLHMMKRKTLSRNGVILRRRGKRRSYWLTRLRFFKKDITNAFCIKIIRRPSALRNLIALIKMNAKPILKNKHRIKPIKTRKKPKTLKIINRHRKQIKLKNIHIKQRTLKNKYKK